MMAKKDDRRNLCSADEVKLFIAVVATASVVVVAPITFSLIANTVMYGTLLASISVAVLAIAGVLLSVAAATESYRRGLSTRTDLSIADMKMALLAEFGEIERVAQAAQAMSSVSVDTEYMRDRPRGVKRWTVDDIAAFYQVRRVRNNIVGGQAGELEGCSLEEALATTRHLRSRI